MIISLPKLYVALLSFALVLCSASAQSLKVGIVDMNRVFAEYYKTKDADKVVNEQKEAAKKELDSIIDNTIIKKCDRSYDICAIKYGPKNNTNETTLVLQEYSKDEGEMIITWEFLLYDRLTDAYVDSRFFSDSKNAFAYFIDKTLNMIDN